MTEITTFKCRGCNGTGGSGPVRKSTGLPFRPCVQCGGDGKIEREVEDVFDKMGRMAAVSLLYQCKGTASARDLKIKTEIESNQKRAEYRKLFGR